MDIYDRVAAWATAYVMTNDFVNATRSRVSKIISDDNIQWVVHLATTFFMPEFLQEVPDGWAGGPEVGDLVETATEIALDIPLGDDNAGNIFKPDGIDDRVADEILGNSRVVEEPAVNESPTEPDGSVDIGGPQVEAEIDEIKKLQQEQEIERADLAGDIENYRDRLTEQYADSPDEMRQQLERFNEAAEEAQKDLAKQQAEALQKLQELQQLLQPPFEL